MFFGQMAYNTLLYMPDFQLHNTVDYYPFGMVMPGRQFQSGNGYRYGFNGMEKDDEIKGQANSLDFGARLYDPRIVRWSSLDHYSNLYESISPYVFALNNPIKFLDADGNVVVDEKGNRVTITISQDENGEYVASFTFMEGTSDEVRKNFLDNGGRVITAAIQIQTGRESVQKAIKTVEKVHYTISPKEKITKEEIEGGTITTFRLGETSTGAIFERAETGMPIGILEYTQNVVIFEGSIDAAIKENDIGDRQKGLTKEQRIGATFVHETEHATDPKEVSNRESGKQHLNEANHDNVRAVEDKAIKEYKENNK